VDSPRGNPPHYDRLSSALCVCFGLGNPPDRLTIPNAVVGKRVMDGVSLLQAWREYLMLTQTDMAERMGISQAGYAQIEVAKRPRKATLQKAADALGITLE